MTSQIIPSMFTGSFELIVTDNQKNTGTTYHETEKKARETEIYIYQQEIINELRDILNKAERLDGSKIDSSDIVFISRIREFIRDQKDYGSQAMTYQIVNSCKPLLDKIMKKVPAVKTVIKDIAWLHVKSVNLYGEYQVQSPELSDLQIKKVRTFNTLTPRERFLAGQEFKIYGPDIFTYVEKLNCLKYEKKGEFNQFHEHHLTLVCIEDDYFGYPNPKRRGPSVLYVKFSGLKF